MSHISSIGAGVFSDLSVSMATDLVVNTYTDATTFQALFKTKLAQLYTAPGLAAAGGFYRIGNARSFPAMGTPPNIVKVPVYGSKTSQSIQGQSDAPQMELDLNFVSADWAKGGVPAAGGATYLGNAVGDGKQYVFRFTLLNTEPTGYASIAGELGAVENSQYFWVGKMESLLVTPSLTDANTAKLTLSIQSAFYGAFTSNAV